MTNHADLADTLLYQLRVDGVQEPVREFRFSPPRRWRFDLAWPALMLAVEAEGGTYIGGRHVTAAGYKADCQKYNAAARSGWAVLRFTGDMIKSGEALADIEAALMEATVMRENGT